MKTPATSLAAAFFAVAFSVSSASATTTTVKFCDDSSDGSNAADNRAASGWSFTDIGANDAKYAQTYAHPVKFKGSTRAQSASTPSGSYLTQISLGVLIGNANRTVTVTPLLESGSTGTPQSAAPSSTGELIEMPFSFNLANCVTGVTVAITASGNSTAYLYYATVTTETSSGGGSNNAPVASQASESVAATVGVVSSLDLSDYFSDADGDTLAYAVASGVGTVSGSTWTYTPAAAGSFSAVVSATDPDGASATMSIAVTAEEPQLPILDVPTGLADSNRSFTSFDLSWNAVSGADGYDVTLSPADGSVVVSGTSATASGLSEGTTYTVNVVATGAGAIDSAPASVQVQTLVHVPLAVPAGLAAVSVSESGFTVSWDTVANAGSYSVSVLDANDAAAGAVSVSGTSATATGLSADTAYSVKVRALAPAGDSPYLDSDWSDSVAVTTALPDGLERATLFDESFSGANNAWANTSAKPGDAETDCDSWTFSANVYNARSAIKVGGASAVGWALSPEITLSNELASADVVLSFSAAAYPAKSTKFSVSLVDSATGETNAISSLTALTPVALDSTSESDLSSGTNYVEEIVVPTRFKLLFETISAGSDKRLLLDSIKVTQIYDPNYAALAAPTGVAASDVGKYGFTVSWTGVANATGYEVWLNDAFEASCDATDTSMALAGLSDGTSYKVQVRALGDNLHHGDSPLSEAVFVETEEDIQNVVFTVTGAPSGDVYAGDPVSFAVAAAVENTGAAVPVGFSGISGAAFENGTFSWTPAETDVGPNVATFASGTYSTNVAISVVSAYVTTNLFHETFPGCTKKWTGTSTEISIDMVDEAGWTFSQNCYSGKGGLRIGLKEDYGSATTRSIEPLGGSGTIQLSFRAAGNAANSSLAVSVSGTGFDYTVPLLVYPNLEEPIPDQDGYVFGPYLLEASGPFTVSFGRASGDGRMGVDEIVVSQTISAKMRVLAAPTGLALSGEAGENGFTVGWNAVDGATNYAVRVLDATGAVAASAPFCAAPSFAATDLPDDEAYAVQVRATGDSATHFDSDWSAPLAVRTERSALHPTLFFGAWQNAVGDGNLHAPIANTAAVSAALDDTTPVPVTYLGATPSPAGTPSFANGTLSWTPADADVGQPYSLAFEMTPEEGVSYVTNVLCTASDLPPLVAPAVSVGETGVKAASFSWDPNPQYRATGYAIRVWRGSKDYTTPDICYEDFFDGTIPADWFATGTPVTGRYSDDQPIRFDTTGDTLVTERHSSPVTSLSFWTKLHGSAGETPSEWTLYASTGGTNETDWVSIGTTSVSTGYQSFDFLDSKNYRRFKWVFTKDSGNMGIGNVSAEHAGAGAVFARGCGSASEARSVGTDRAFTCDTLRADTEYFIEVTVTDGTTTQSAIRRFQTLPAPKATVIVVQ